MSENTTVNVSLRGPITAASKQPASVRMIVAIACAAQFVLVLNTAIINVALPGMHTELGLSVETLQWVVNGYLVTFGGFLLLVARAGDHLGEKKVFMTGLVIFVLASLAAGMAEDGTWLVVARLAQGIGASAMAPATMSMIVKSPISDHHKARSLMLWSVMSSAGAGAGVILGGALTSWLGWRSVLYINIPIGVLLIIGAAVYLVSVPERNGAGHGLDIPGAVTVTAGAVALIYALSAASATGWGSPQVIGALIATVVLGVAFTVVELRSSSPLVPFSIFRHRPLSIANMLMVTVGITLTSSLYFLSLYEEQILGYSPLLTGTTLTPMNVMFIVGGLASRSLMARFGPKALLIVGALVAAAGMAWLTGIGIDSAYAVAILGPTLLIGAGLSVLFVPIITAATMGFDRQHVGFASGLVNTSRQIGGAVGLAVLVTIAASVTQVSGTGTTAGAATVIDGYRAAFLIAAAVSLAAALIAALLPGTPKATPAPTPLEPVTARNSDS